MLDGVNDNTALLKEFKPPADFVPAWLNYSLTLGAFKDLGGVYGKTVPALIVMDFTPGSVSTLCLVSDLHVSAVHTGHVLVYHC